MTTMAEKPCVESSILPLGTIFLSDFQRIRDVASFSPLLVFYRVATSCRNFR